MTPRRIVSISLPHFAIQCWRRRVRTERGPAEASAGDAAIEEEPPLVLAGAGAHGPVIHDMNAPAHALGLRRGRRVTDMRALVPGLRVEDAAPEADAGDLARLARWARRWSPWTQVEGARGLLLDITGTAHLFGGEAAMIADMRRAFAAAGLTAHVAASPTPGAAWALARYGGAALSVCEDGALAQRLAPLPVAALRLDEATVTLLGRLGLKTVGALAAVPGTALRRRFRRVEAAWANPVLRLNQAMGRTAEPLMPDRVPPRLRALRRLAEPVGDIAGVAHVLELLLDELCAHMARAGVGARRLRLTGYRVDGIAVHIEAATSRGSRDPRHLGRLFEGKLERLDAGFGFDAIGLEAVSQEALQAEQTDIAGGRAQGIDLARLVDRLVARLGAAAVCREVAHGSHIPERAGVLAAMGALPATVPAQPGEMERPLRLLAPAEEAQVIHAVPDGPPARFVWRRQVHRITRSEGPERIAPEWWRERSTVRLRDYYRVEDGEGRRFWLYREGLAGDGRGETPRWFVHGLFA